MRSYDELYGLLPEEKSGQVDLFSPIDRLAIERWAREERARIVGAQLTRGFAWAAVQARKALGALRHAFTKPDARTA